MNFKCDICPTSAFEQFKIATDILNEVQTETYFDEENCSKEDKKEEYK
jgi:hypothetical protein